MAGLASCQLSFYSVVSFNSSVMPLIDISLPSTSSFISSFSSLFFALTETQCGDNICKPLFIAKGKPYCLPFYSPIHALILLPCSWIYAFFAGFYCFISIRLPFLLLVTLIHLVDKELVAKARVPFKLFYHSTVNSTPIN